MENWSAHHLFQQASDRLGTETAIELQHYAQSLRAQKLPVVFSLNHLGKICGVSYRFLRETVARERETSNYRMFAVAKRSGGRRFIHAVRSNLLAVQTFINEEILQKRNPHPCSYAFHSSGGIRKCAAAHCGARFLFQFDLTDFFYDVTEIDVFHIFNNLGYRRLLSFELARLCTTTRLPQWHPRGMWLEASDFSWGIALEEDEIDQCPYKHVGGLAGVLPQGAPSSPMLVNLAAMPLDKALSKYAEQNNLVYTRYADDITFSASWLTKRRGRIQSDIIHLIRKSGFKENEKKIRIAGPGSKKLVLGLLVDGAKPRLSRETYKRIDRLLHGSMKYGLNAARKHFGFESTYGFHNHLGGLIAFVKDVDSERWREFSNRFRQIKRQEAEREQDEAR